jgi:hypothetical protein
MPSIRHYDYPENVYKRKIRRSRAVGEISRVPSDLVCGLLFYRFYTPRTKVMRTSLIIGSWTTFALGSLAKLQGPKGICREAGDCESKKCGFTPNSDVLLWSYKWNEESAKHLPPVKDDECNMILQGRSSRVRICRRLLPEC